MDEETVSYNWQDVYCEIGKLLLDSFIDKQIIEITDLTREYIYRSYFKTSTRMNEELKHIKVVIRSRKSKEDRQYKGQKYKQ